jgi:hypothetical protein
MIFNFSIDDLYDINFQSNGGFFKIRIHCNIIRNWSTMNHLARWSILEFTVFIIILTLKPSLHAIMDLRRSIKVPAGTTPIHTTVSKRNIRSDKYDQTPQK